MPVVRFGCYEHLAVPGVNREGVVFRIEADYEDTNPCRRRLFVAAVAAEAVAIQGGDTQQIPPVC